MKKLVSTFILAMVVCHLATGQRIKYKDLYPLLSVQKYDQAEPFLKEFIKDEKNRDKYPNSLLQMGLIFSNKSMLSDVLKETEQSVYYADSAIYYYELAIKFIDDREVRKNEEYYQAYKRRDIRTGEFGIKLTDIHFDLEEKIKELKKRKSSVVSLSDYFYRATNSYDSASQMFANIKTEYPAEKQLLLRLDNTANAKLEKLRAEYQHAVENFRSYQNTLEDISKPGYNQAMVIREIVDYENVDPTSVDFFSSNVEIWNYSKWAEGVIEKHQKEIVPLFKDLVMYDQILNELAGKVKRDSVSMIDDIPAVKSQASFINLKNFDPDPMPLSLFRYKAEDLRYQSLLMKYPNFKDSADLLYQQEILNKQVFSLNKMDSLINTLLAMDIVKEAKNYEPFVASQFNDTDGLRVYIKNKLDYVLDEKRKKELQMEEVMEKSRWLLTRSDSIPLFIPEAVGEAKYLPLVIDSLVTAGLYFSGDAPAQGYLANVTASRKASVDVKFDINSEYFNKANYETLSSESLVLIGGGESIYFTIFYTPIPEEDGYVASVVRANDDGLKWSNEINLSAKPGQLAYNIQTDEIIINYELPEMQGVGGQLVGNKVTLSKTGEIVDP